MNQIDERESRMDKSAEEQTLLENGGFKDGTAPGVKPVTGKGGQPAYFSCWDIHAYYGESYIVQGVSFDIREGEIVALLGRNGAGKTSTLRAIARLGERRNQEATTLSGGEQQMLAISRALARDVKLLLLDEPYEGLAPVIVQEIERTLEEIKSHGMTTIIVEQNAIAALHLADRAIILDMGKVVFDGLAQEVLENADMRQQYLAI